MINEILLPLHQQEDATDFGDLSVLRNGVSNASSATRGVLRAGGYNSSGSRRNNIEFITIATTGNAVDFGDLFQETRNGG